MQKTSTPVTDDLKGKRALVLGASRGIGRETAIALAKKNCLVTVLARDSDMLQETVHHMKEASSLEHDWICCDQQNLGELAEKIDNSLTGGPFHILVCNSGGPAPGPLLEASEETLRSAFEVHILANTLLVKRLVPGMRADSYGRIINIISTSVKAPIPNLGASNTIRGAVASWAKTLATELAADGITVNNVLPGYTKTSRLDALLASAAEKSGKSLETVITEWENKVPAKRFAEPEEVAAAVAFLASPEAAYCNGINLPVDGGRTPCL